MGRRKKSNIEVELENEIPAEEAVSEEPSESEWESEEAVSLSESEQAESKEDEEMKADSEEEEAAPKPKRQRRSRKKAAESVEVAPIEEPTEMQADAEVASEEASEEAVAPKKAARGRAKKNEDASDTVPMFQQWKTLQEITASMAANFERIHRQMNDLQGNYIETAERLAKQAPAKPPVMTKVAMGVAMFSVVISLLSLSFAQSVRNNIVANQASTARVAQSAPSLDAGSLAMNPADDARKSIAGSRKRTSPRTKK